MDPNSIRMLQEAVTHLQAGRLDQGKSILNGLSLSYPGHPDVEHMLAMAAKSESMYEKALKHFQNSLRAKPDQPGVLLNMGNLLQENGDIYAAVEAYRTVVSHAPDLANAWYNLAIVLSKSGEHKDAEKAAKRFETLTPGTHRGAELRAYIYQMQGDGEKARAVYQQLLGDNPGNAQLWLAYASFLRAEADFSAATEAYKKAKSLGVVTGELFLNLAEAYYETKDITHAVETYQEGLSVLPSDAALHFANAKFLWETKADGDHLAALKSAIPQQPNNIALWGSYFDLLSYERRFEDILKGIGEAYRVGIRAPRLSLAEAVAKSETGETVAATELFEGILRNDPVAAVPRHCFAEHLLKAGELERAEKVCADILQRNPGDQKAWTFRGTAWQLLSDPRADWLFDFENMVHSVEVETPSGYANQAEFFAVVRRELDELHNMQAHPIDQTLRGGTQTNGFLFRTKNSIILQLKEQLKRAVEKTVAKFPDEPDHPFWGRKKRGIDFAGAWSVRLRSQGFHTNHFHPEGWISSALYVSLPEEVKTGKGTEGHIQFGEPVTEMNLDLRPARTIKPKVGQLALFPSYMWHGTVPFKSEQPRITVAFDIIPIG